MQKLFIILWSVIFFTGSLFAQKIKEGVFEHNILGKVKLKKVLDEDDKTFYSLEGEGTYNHEKYGVVNYEILYFDDGSFGSWKDTYQDPVLGEVTIERSNRLLNRSYINSKGVKHTKRVYYYDKDTTVIKESYSYVGGKKEGKYKLFYPDGKLKIEENYLKGNKFGPFKKYYENGQIKEKGSYAAKELLDGTYTIYRENGEVILNRTFVEGRRFGKWETSKFSDDRFFEFKSTCMYDKDSAFCVEKEFYVRDKSNDLRTVTTYKKVNEFKSYLRPNSYDEFGHLKHGVFKKLYAGILLKEGIYANGNKVGIWKVFHENGNLKYQENYVFDESAERSVIHGFDKRYDEEGKLTGTFKFHKGKRIDFVKLDWVTFLSGWVFIIIVGGFVYFNNTKLKPTLEENNKLRISGLLIGTCLILLFTTSIRFLENGMNSLFNVDFGWTEIISGGGLSFLISVTILLSLKEKPLKKSLFLGILGFAVIWITAMVIGVLGNRLLIFLVSLVFPLYDEDPLVTAILISIACFSGVLFIHKYWKIKNKVNYVYFFIISLLLNLIAGIILMQPWVDEVLYSSDNTSIIFTLNYVLVVVLLSVNAENDVKYTKKIKNSFLAYTTFMLVFSSFLTVYKYIDPFKTDCEKVSDIENYIETISQKLKEDTDKLNEDYKEEYGFYKWVPVTSIVAKHIKELEEIDRATENHKNNIEAYYNKVKGTQDVDCSILLEQHVKLKTLVEQRAEKVWKIYKREIHTVFENEKNNKK